MIITITPNPSIDRTLRIDSLSPGDVHRVSTVTSEAGGKGINVARALALAGYKSACVYPGDSADGDFTKMLGGIDGLSVVPVDTSTGVRTNISIIETDGRTTKVNEPGEELSAAHQDMIFDAVANLAAEAADDSLWIAVCGSLPPGVSPDFAVRLRDHVGGQAKLAIDASGEALQRAAASGADLLKPNQHELAELVDRSLPTLGDIVDAAIEVQESGVETVVVSLGGDGALLVTKEGVVHGTAPTNVVTNTVGAGDAFLAGFLSVAGSGNHGPDSTALSEALSWGRAAVASPSTAFPPATDDDRSAVVISSVIERDRVLEG